MTAQDLMRRSWHRAGGDPDGRWFAEVVGLSLALFLMGRLGLAFAYEGSQISEIRPTAGVALAVLLWRGARLWPAVLLGSFLARYTHTDHVVGSLLLSAGGTLQTLAGVWMMRRWAEVPVDFGSLRQVVRFLVFGAILPAALGGMLMASLIVAMNEPAGVQWLSACTLWFLGSALGVAVFAPLLLNVFIPTKESGGDAGRLETGMLFVLLIGVVVQVFTSELPVAFTPFPLLVWAGLRLGVRAQTAAVVLVVVVALVATASGWGPFAHFDIPRHTRLLLLQGYIVLLVASSLVFGALATGRRRAVLALARLTDFQRALLDGSKFSLIVCSPEARIVSVNRGCEELLGYTEAELLGRDPRLWHDSAEVLEQARDISRQAGRAVDPGEAFIYWPTRGVPNEREWTFIRKDGSRVPVLLSITVLGGEQGKFSGFMGVAVDITVRKQAEAQIRAAQAAAEQASRAKSEFLANMSHEIRTPMNAILGFAELLQRDLANPAHRKQAAAIVASGKTLLQLINDVLDLSKVEAGRLEIQPAPADVRKLLAEVRQAFALKARETGLELKLDIETPLEGCYLLDEVRVRQILFNLLGNALKFTERGSVVLAARLEADPGHGHRLHLDVRDTGIGIKREELPRLFQPFHQQSGQSNRKYGGTGLGLSISRRLAELMGGALIVCSEEGQGSTFRLTLPRLEPAFAPVVHPSGTSAAYRFQPACVLIVDDVRYNLDLAEAYLAGTGLTSISAQDGATALRLAAEQPPAAVLLDIRLPDIGGVEVHRRLRANPATAAVPIIAVTASSLSEEEAHIRATFSGFLRKPVSAEQLLAALAQFLPLAPAASPVAAGAPAPAAATPATLSFAALAAWRECADRAVGPWREAWEKLGPTPVADEVEQFAARVAAGAGPDSPAWLRAYGERLAAHARDFEIAALTQALQEFPAVTERLRAGPGSPPAASVPAEEADL